MKKKLAILGATGSIGESAARVVAAFPDRFEVVGLAARRRTDRLAELAAAFRPDTVVATDPDCFEALRRSLPAGVRAACGEAALLELAGRPEVDIVLCAIVGTAGLRPVLAALEAGKTVALASKEVLVMAGELVMAAAKRHGGAIIPVDSEHSALFQCLAGRRPEEVARLILTASGGAFRDLSAEALKQVDCAAALRHPVWSMGPKVTIDSASLMNKALELVEAHHLFSMPPEKLDVVIHPQSVVHSMLELVDRSLLAQFSVPDMRFAIQYALSWPDRLPGDALPRLDFAAGVKLEFFTPDRRKYPSLDFARTAMEQGGALPAVMNAANEVAVAKFRAGAIRFPAIWTIIEKTMAAHSGPAAPALDELIEADRAARRFAEALKL